MNIDSDEKFRLILDRLQNGGSNDVIIEGIVSYFENKIKSGKITEKVGPMVLLIAASYAVNKKRYFHRISLLICELLSLDSMMYTFSSDFFQFGLKINAICLYLANYDCTCDVKVRIEIPFTAESLTSNTYECKAFSLIHLCSCVELWCGCASNLSTRHSFPKDIYLTVICSFLSSASLFGVDYSAVGAACTALVELTKQGSVHLQAAASIDICDSLVCWVEEFIRYVSDNSKLMENLTRSDLESLAKLVFAVFDSVCVTGSPSQEPILTMLHSYLDKSYIPCRSAMSDISSRSSSSDVISAERVRLSFGVAALLCCRKYVTHTQIAFRSLQYYCSCVVDSITCRIVCEFLHAAISFMPPFHNVFASHSTKLLFHEKLQVESRANFELRSTSSEISSNKKKRKRIVEMEAECKSPSFGNLEIGDGVGYSIVSLATTHSSQTNIDCSEAIIYYDDISQALDLSWAEAGFSWDKFALFLVVMESISHSLELQNTSERNILDQYFSIFRSAWLKLKSNLSTNPKIEMDSLMYSSVHRLVNASESYLLSCCNDDAMRVSWSWLHRLHSVCTEMAPNLQSSYSASLFDVQSAEYFAYGRVCSWDTASPLESYVRLTAICLLLQPDAPVDGMSAVNSIVSTINPYPSHYVKEHCLWLACVVASTICKFSHRVETSIVTNICVRISNFATMTAAPHPQQLPSNSYLSSIRIFADLCACFMCNRSHCKWPLQNFRIVEFTKKCGMVDSLGSLQARTFIISRLNILRPHTQSSETLPLQLHSDESIVSTAIAMWQSIRGAILASLASFSADSSQATVLDVGLVLRYFASVNSVIRSHRSDAFDGLVAEFDGYLTMALRQMSDKDVLPFKTIIALSNIVSFRLMDASACNSTISSDNNEIFEAYSRLLDAPSSTVVILGISRAIKGCCFVNIEFALQLLFILIRGWQAANCSDNTANLSLIYTEICNLRREGILKYLAGADMQRLVQQIYVKAIIEFGAENVTSVLDAFTSELVEDFGESIRAKLASWIVSKLCVAEYFSNADRRESLSSLLSTVRLPASSMVLDADSLFLYGVLASPQIFSQSNSEKSAMLRVVSLLESLLKFANQKSKFSGGDSFFTQANVNEILLLIVWDFGGTPITCKSAHRAIRILCLLARRDGWYSVDLLNKLGFVSSPNAFSVPAVLSTNFLYLMSNLLYSKWSTMTFLQQQHSLRALCEVLPLLPSDNALQYFPKILTMLDNSMHSNCLRVRCCGINLIRSLVTHLPLAAIGANLYVLVSSLFAIFEENIYQGPSGSSNITSEAQAVFGMLETRLPLAFFLPDSAELDSCQYNCFSFMAESFSSIVDAIWADKCLEEAASILQFLFVDNLTATRSVLKHFPKLPMHPKLKEIISIHSGEIASLTQADMFNNLISSLKHDSIDIRIRSLRALREFCMQNRKLLYKAVGGAEAGNVITKPQVFLLITTLMYLCERESDHRLIEECANCLGEIGAIDPALWTEGTASQKSSRRTLRPPWDSTVPQFGLMLLEAFLIPNLKAAGKMHDKLGFAIQRILKTVASHWDASINKLSNEDAASMPQELKTALESKSNLEIVLPFWSSRYNLEKDGQVGAPTFFRMDKPFALWVGQWVRYLSSFCNGNFLDYFSACKVAVREMEGLSLFLLPYVICDVLLNDGTNQHLHGMVAEIRIVLEINTSSHHENHRHASDNAKCIQAILDLMDTFVDWAYREFSTDIRPSSATVQLQSQLKKLLRAIPKALMGAAALHLKAYSRALRYFEEVTRMQWKSSSCVAVYHNNGSNGSIPLLSEEDVQRYMGIYSRLDVIDALDGVQTIRQIAGYAPTQRCRILDCEQNNDWLGALMEYDIMLNSLKSNESESASSTEQSILLEPFNIDAIERGRLRCLIELGHMENAIDQAVGVFKRDSQLINSLFPVAAEASWRLMNWDRLDYFLAFQQKESVDSRSMDEMFAVNAEDKFQCTVGSLLLSIKTNNATHFRTELKLAQRDVMSALSTAAVESFERAYLSYSRLHILQELCDGLVLKQCEGRGAGQQMKLESFCWNDRLQLMASSPSLFDSIKAIRRSILGACNLPNHIGQNWLSVCSDMRKLRRFDSAKLALRNAQRFDLGEESSDIVLIQECLILKDMGETNRALKLLEPIEVDVNVLKAKLSGHTGTLSDFNQLLKRFHLATKLMVESRQKVGRAITDRYNLLIDATKGEENEKVSYEFARYMESLYEDTRLRDDHDSLGSAASSRVRGGINVIATIDESRNMDEPQSFKYIKQSVNLYGRCLVHGSYMLTQALPRMLTLWFSFMDIVDAPSSTKQGRQYASSLQQAQKSVNDYVSTLVLEVNADKWYTCMTQLVSRLGHRNPATNAVITSILEKVLFAFPAHGIWHLASLLKSSNASRCKIANAILERTINSLKKKNQMEHASMLVESKVLFNDLVNLAEDLPKLKVISFPIGKGIRLNRFVVPTQAVMLRPPGKEIPTSATAADRALMHSDQMHILRFHDEVEVASSKARPKTLTLTTTCGKVVKFLSKREKDGDLRKDARMMEFNSVVNRLLSEDSQGRRRAIQLKTYAVVCLNEECGLLEWVNNTKCIRHLIADSQRLWPDVSVPSPNMKDIVRAWPEFQKNHKFDVVALTKEYRRLITSKSAPCFHRWFLHAFPDASQWLEARTRFSRSAAVWSAVGHVIGLGDRHTENILLDYSNGECVHVDFDCLFDKGLTLERPEVVPFRLTPNIVDAMGVTGIEGVFRRTMEICLHILRENKDILLSVLEPFLRDPTVAWKRNGRAQRDATALLPPQHAAVAANDQENEDASEALKIIDERLSGVYNLHHPLADGIIKSYYSRTKSSIIKGAGAQKKEELPLSVEGQVNRLIEEAIAEENLAQMFIGWMPWM